MTKSIVLSVTDEQLDTFKKAVEKLVGGEVTDPLLMMTFMLQNEITTCDAYVDTILDSGGNSVYDVLTDEDAQKCYVEQQYDDE